MMSSSLARRGERRPVETDAATRYTLALAPPNNEHTYMRVVSQ